MSVLAFRNVLEALGSLLPQWPDHSSAEISGRQPWEPAAARSATRAVFRFGLSGLRWGTSGPVVLMVHDAGGRPTQFRYFLQPVLASGRQIIALETGSEGRSPSAEEVAMSLLEAAVEIPNLEAVVGHGDGARAVLQALAQGLPAERAVLIALPDADGFPPPATAQAGHPTVPALVVHDLDDRQAAFATSEALVRAWPRARLLATSGLGHAGVLSDATVTQGVAEFLAGHSAGLTTTQLSALARAT